MYDHPKKDEELLCYYQFVVGWLLGVLQTVRDWAVATPLPTTVLLKLFQMKEN